MCCQKIWQRILPFAITGMLGVLMTGVVHKIVRSNNVSTTATPCVEKVNTLKKSGEEMERTTPATNSSQIPQNYTQETRQNEVTGGVHLRIVFLPSGESGGVTPVSQLPNRLTERRR